MTRFIKEDNCLYMTYDLSNLGVYERAKAIVDFCDKDIKEFEKNIDRAIVDIFERNGINITSTKKNALKVAFATLKRKGKDIEITDLYKEQVDLYNSELIKETKYFTIWLEDDTYLQVGVSVEEKQLHGRFEL